MAIRNTSIAVLRLVPSGIPPTWRGENRPTDFTGQVVASLVPGGESVGGYLLLPRSTAVASSRLPIDISVEVIGDTAEAYVATFMGEWVQKMIKPTNSLISSVANCGRGAKNLLIGGNVPWEDAFLTLVQSVPACSGVVKSVAEASGERKTATQVANDVIRVGKEGRAGQLWDDLVRLLGRIQTLFPR